MLGAVILEPAQLWLAYNFGASRLYLVFYAAVFLVVILLLPRGIIPSVGDLLKRIPRRGSAGPNDVTLLEVDGLSKRFGGVTAVDGCSLALQPGSITGLIGPNGSGKTTVFNLVTGFLSKDAGEVRFNGRSIGGLSPNKIYGLGIG